MKRSLRNLILGPDKYIEDYSLYMRARLLGYLALVAIFIASFYLLMNTFYYGRVAGDIQYAAVIAFSFLTLYLTRIGKYTLATTVQLIIVNSVVFFFSFYDYKDGNYFFFLSNALSALVLYGYTKRWLSLGAVLFTLVLFVMAYTGVFGYFSEHEYRLHPLYNFIFVFLICVSILQYKIRLHHHSEQITKTKNTQLQKVNAELDRFVYSASHDLRAPLSSLLGLIELARKTDDRAEIETYLTMMKGRIHHLDDFIKEIIDYSRNERMEVVRLPVNLYQLLEETTTNLKHLEGAETIIIQNQVPADLVIQSDAMRLKIVFNNLLNNAIKYHDLNKESRNITISISSTTSGTSVSVRDNGMGIAPEHHDKVFNMFYRASDKSKGSGLGLYIVKESLAQIGGSISLKSTLGKGSTFTVELPA